jgi:hypothetical protein
VTQDRRNNTRKTPEECLRIAVESLGGLQEVGHMLRPDMDPALAGQWLSHCLTSTKRDKLSEQQRHLIWRRAHAIGAHEGYQAFARSLGYSADPITVDAQLVDAIKRAEAARLVAAETANDLASILDNPRLIATLKAANINVDALT